MKAEERKKPLKISDPKKKMYALKKGDRSTEQPEHKKPGTF
jgi:hypothetical protein